MVNIDGEFYPMVYDICLKIKDLGDIYGSFIKASTNSIYLSNAILSKSSGVSISLFKIEKKYVITVTRMAIPSFEKFTEEQLQRVIALKNPTYTQAVQRVMESRKSQESPSDSVKTTAIESHKSWPIKSSGNQEKKEWNQFEANKKLFGVEPTFNVDEYACSINRSGAEYTATEMQAEKIAKGLAAQEAEMDGPDAPKKGESTDDVLYSTVHSADKWGEIRDVRDTRDTRDIRDTNKPTAEESVSGKTVDTKKTIDKEIDQSYQDFEKEGWHAIAKFLNKKKVIKSGSEIPSSSPVKPAESVLPSVNEGVSKVKKDGEGGSRVKGTIHEGNEGEQHKSQKPRDKIAMGSRKQSKSEQKTSRQVQSENSDKFSSALELIELIIKNFSHKQPDHKSNWNEAQGIKEDLYAHVNPLDSFEFPSCKIQEIQKFNEKKFYPPKTFK